MPATWRPKAVSLAAVLILASTGALPAASGFAAETNSLAAPELSYDLLASPVIADDSVDARIQEQQSEEASFKADETVSPTAAEAEEASAELDAELECMTKVIHKEARNQSRKGQLAVAQIVMNRIKSGSFPNTVCGVANQPRQFFQTASYNPNRDTAQWRTALSVAREALAGSAPAVVPGAMFYHADYIAPNSWFRTRQRVATLGNHIFYR
jgi:spore germination cell wall hydrolase CwlJ-like protein